mgnify:CR=1 FL=1
MSKLTVQFSLLHIHNQYAFADAEGSPVWITYRPSDKWTSPGWLVCRNGFKTDPKASWKDYGCKFFLVGLDKTRQEQLEVAKQWASEKYGIKEWAKTPYGAWMEAEFVKSRTAELKARVKLLAEGTTENNHDKRTAQI